MAEKEEQPTKPTPPLERIFDVSYNFVLDKIFFILILLMLYIWNKCGSRVKSIKREMFLTADIARVIEENIIEIRVQTSADRVLYGEFHNGVEGSKDSANIHLYRFSAINEVVKPGTSEIKEDIKNIPCDKLYEEVSDLYNNNGIIDIDIENCNKRCRRHLRSIGVNRVIEALVLIEDEPTGIISIQYTNDSLNEIKVNYDDLRDKIDSISYKILKCKQKHSNNPIVRVLNKLG